MKFAQLYRSESFHKSLGFKLGVIIVIKILFLIGLWNLVLQYQAVHIETSDMSNRLLTQSDYQSQER